MKATLVLALVASATGVILRGPSVVSDTYIRNLWPTWPLNAETQGWWDGPLTISATQVISGVTTDTSALLIQFDLRPFVGATLVPGKPAWLNYFVSDAGNIASLRELVVPWNEVCARRPRRRALPLHTQPRAAPWPRPLRADAFLPAPSCPSLLSTDHSHVEQPPVCIGIVEAHQRSQWNNRNLPRRCWLE